MQLAALPKGGLGATSSLIPEAQPTTGSHLYRRSSGAGVLHSTLNHLQVGTAGVLSAELAKAAAQVGLSLVILVQAGGRPHAQQCSRLCEGHVCSGGYGLFGRP